MSFIRTIADGEATGRAREMFDQDVREDGFVNNLTRVLALRPDVVDAWRGLSGAIRSKMDLRRYELVTLASAQALCGSYCSLAHGQVLREKFFGADEMLAIARDGAHESLTPADVAVMGFARKVARDAAGVTAADVQVLRDNGLADSDVLDVVLAVAARSFFCKLLDGVGVQPDSAYGSLDEDLRAALTVGRPISQGEPR